MKLLLTGATGKVGQAFLPRFLASKRFADWDVVALCNNRVIDETDRVSVVRGSLANKDVIRTALTDVTHILHMAAVKESPDMAIDVAVKGMFLMLEEFRQSAEAQQFVLIGGDCSVGHIFHNYTTPITERSPRKAYAGCYALTKVIEEVMLEQYGFQYGLPGCILRAPWIMEKDDFKCAMSFGPDQFGGPAWTDYISCDDVSRHADAGAVPLMQDNNGAPLKRNFVHVDDLVSAVLAALDNPKANGETFNISMDEPVDYGKFATYMQQSRALPAAEIATPHFSNWLDNTKAKHILGWSPDTDMEGLIERAWNHKRDKNDPRKIWYPG